jgi:hypothetical protein
VLDRLSRNIANVVNGLGCTTEDGVNQSMTGCAKGLSVLTALVEKRGETLTPLNPRIGTITRVDTRNVGAGSGRKRIAWYRDKSTTLQVWLTSTTSCDAVLCEAEGDTPEVVGKVDVVVLEAELTVRRVRSNTGTPESSARRTEGP